MTSNVPVMMQAVFPDTKLPSLQAIASQCEVGEFAVSIDAEFRTQLGRMLEGVAAYHAHGYFRNVTDPPVRWSEGGTKLFRFAPQGDGLPVLIVPSLVNKSYILDLNEEGSFCRTMAEAGLCPYLVDWGEPQGDDADFGLDEYVARLARILDFIVEDHGTGSTVSMVGYCMGGLLALPLAISRQDIVDRLVLMATPWDFHSSQAPGRNATEILVSAIEPVLTMFGKLPVDCVQAMFAAIDPLNAFKKFRYFADLDQESDKARQFVALEDWLNDGVSLSAPVARETLGGWYAQNSTVGMQWRIHGEVVNPADFLGETLVVIPKSDRIVPPDSALAITELLADVRLLRPALGHVGMMSGRRAAELWTRVARFLSV